jgi:hypothetical protein
MGWLLLVPALFVLYLVVALAIALYLEVRRTSWSLLEALIAVNIIGHVIAWPVASAWQIDPWCTAEQRAAFVAAAALGGSLVAACMGGGAVWVFRRLKILGEKRTGTRILYMLGGLFLFPSFVAAGACGLAGFMMLLTANLLPSFCFLLFGFVVASIVWPPLYRLHRKTKNALSGPPAAPPSALRTAKDDQAMPSARQ